MSHASHEMASRNEETLDRSEHMRRLEALFKNGPQNQDAPDTGSAPIKTAPHAIGMTPGAPSPRGGSARPKRQVFSSPRRSNGRSPTEYRLRLERLRISRSDEEIKEAADQFLAHHQLPDDLDVLYKLLRHPEERVLREAMGQISALLMQGRLPSVMLLQDRLADLKKRDNEAATLSYIDGLSAQLDRIQQGQSQSA